MFFHWKRVFLAAWVAVMFLSATHRAFADGCYIPEKAIHKIPEIPGQTALLKWKDGEETLVIASTLDSQSQSLGWILPLPSTPSVIAKADPGMLRTLEFCVQPRITHELPRGAGSIIGWGFVLIGLLATFVFLRSCFARAVILVLLFLLLSAIALPTFGLRGFSMQRMPTTLRVEKTATVGSYDIAVLSAKNIGDLNAWLTENGFSIFPDAAGPAVADYIAKNWVFAAIRLTRGETGANTPHPILVTFRSQEAIYPMRLTALPGNAPVFQLFVIGDKRAGSDLLQTEYCEAFEKGGDPRSPEYGNKIRDMSIAGYSFSWAGHAQQAIAHPDILPLMGERCVLTKLSGTIPPAKMGADLKIAWSDYQPLQQHFYTVTGATSLAWFWGVLLFEVFVLASIIIAHKKAKPSGVARWWLLRALPAACLCVVIGAAIYFAVPKLPADETRVMRGSGFTTQFYTRELASEIAIILEQTPPPAEKSSSEIGKEILSQLTAAYNGQYPNKLQGGNLSIDTSPGNFDVQKHDGKIIVRVFDEIGYPIKIVDDGGKVTSDIPILFGR